MLRHDGVRLVAGPVRVGAFVRLLHRVRELDLGLPTQLSPCAALISWDGASSLLATTTGAVIAEEIPWANSRTPHWGGSKQWVILGLQRVPGVLKGVQRGLVGPLGPLELSALLEKA